jgi:chromosome segregation ATPase
MSTDVTTIKVDVEVLKSQLSTLTNLCEKMDKVIEKIVDHQGVIINQIYDDMDKREDDTNADIKELHERITNTTKELSDKVNETERRIMEELKTLREQIDAHNRKEDDEISQILKWKWTIVGGIIVLSWLTQNIGLDTILKMLQQ